MYSYVGDWAIPRSQRAEMEKSYAAYQSILDKAIASGTIMVYGKLNVLEQFYKWQRDHRGLDHRHQALR